MAEDGVDYHPAAGRVAGLGPAGAGQDREAARVDVVDVVHVARVDVWEEDREDRKRSIASVFEVEEVLDLFVSEH